MKKSLNYEIFFIFLVMYLPLTNEKRKANIQEIPSLLALLVHGTHNCGASVISEYWALTAAHCLEKCSAKDILLRSKSSNTEYGGKLHPVKTLLIHPKYNNFSLDYDFAVIQVAIPFKNHHAAILTKTEPLIGNFISYGWSATQVRGVRTLELTANEVILEDREECIYRYKSFFTKRMICAGGNGEDSCQGDSGGPLIDKITKVQVGIVSWGRECRNAYQPGVYSNIADQIMWITNVSGMETRKPEIEPMESVVFSKVDKKNTPYKLRGKLGRSFEL